MYTFIIAEAGVNHNGSFDLARRLVDVAVEAGVDAVKFQTFKAEKIATKYAQKAQYQKGKSEMQESQLKMLKNVELPYSDFIKLKKYCEEKNIIFLSSPFDLESADFLYNLGIDIFKIPSGEITNYLLLKRIGSYNKKIILSTGMADLGEIEDAIDLIVESGTKRENIALLHCTTEYPAPMEEINLKAMLTLKVAFCLPVGYSDHTEGSEIPIAAVAMGATIIEKHFTLDKSLPGPDHSASLEPGELKSMVKAIRNIEKAMGDGIKKPSMSELKNRDIVRKSIVAARRIKRGEIFTGENLTLKRPGYGISPMRWNEIIGKIANKDYEEDEIIEI